LTLLFQAQHLLSLLERERAEKKEKEIETETEKIYRRRKW
jgi:hypothetical protein